MQKRGGKVQHDHSLLEMALVGYESAKEAIEKKITEIRKSIRRPGAIAAAVEQFTSAKPKRRKMSAAGRKRIAAAQKKRWAEKRNAEKPAPKVKRKRPKLSAAEVSS